MKCKFNANEHLLTAVGRERQGRTPERSDRRGGSGDSGFALWLQPGSGSIGGTRLSEHPDLIGSGLFSTAWP